MNVARVRIPSGQVNSIGFLGARKWSAAQGEPLLVGRGMTMDLCIVFWCPFVFRGRALAVPIGVANVRPQPGGGFRIALELDSFSLRALNF